MRYSFLIIAISLTVSSNVTAAEEFSWYIQANGGVNYLSDINGSYATQLIGGGSTNHGRKAEYDKDKLFGISIGKKLENNLRLEAQFNHRDNDLSRMTNKVNGGDVNNKDYSNNIKSDNLMFNLLYDFRNTTNITPYLGAGIGISRIKFEYSQVHAGKFSDTDTTYAFQLLGGASWTITEKIDLVAQYQYFKAPNVSLKSSLSGAPGGLSQVVTYKFDDSYEDHSLSVGARINF